MSVTRLVLEGVPLTAGSLWLPAPVARHARVARVVPGECVEVLNLAGEVAVGRLGCWDGQRCRVDIDRVERERGEPPAPLVLALAVLHTGAFDWAVEKATELGVTAIVPVLCERVQKGRHEIRRERWQRLASAAVAQCGRTRAPRVGEPAPLGELMSHAQGVRLVADPAALWPGAFRAGSEGVTVLVGPEGGFTPVEVEAVHAAGFVGLPLGPRVLRAETAAIAALAVAQSLTCWL